MSNIMATDQRAVETFSSPEAIGRCFFSDNNDFYVNRLINSSSLSNYFNPTTTNRLLQKWRNCRGNLTSERENMVFIGILSTLLIHELFISGEMKPGK